LNIKEMTMPTSVLSVTLAKAHDQTESVVTRIAFGLLLTSAAVMLLVGAVAAFGADAAAADTFALIGAF
jgi:hypothetical protein